MRPHVRDGRGSLAAGCVTTPALEGYGVPISEVVQRIKCELVEAVPDPDQQDRLYRSAPCGCLCSDPRRGGVRLRGVLARRSAGTVAAG